MPGLQLMAKVLWSEEGLKKSPLIPVLSRWFRKAPSPEDFSALARAKLEQWMEERGFEMDEISRSAGKVEGAGAYCLITLRLTFDEDEQAAWESYGLAREYIQRFGEGNKAVYYGFDHQRPGGDVSRLTDESLLRVLRIDADYLYAEL